MQPFEGLWWLVFKLIGEAEKVKGAYALLIEVSSKAELVVGALGVMEFNPGIYVYVGSALGPGGIEARVARHLRREKRLKWHIDYLLAAKGVSVRKVVFSEAGRGDECRVVGVLKELGLRVVNRFGACDCKMWCGGHLLCCDGGLEWCERMVMRAFESLGLMPRIQGID